jgi:hypothetical protein
MAFETGSKKLEAKSWKQRSWKQKAGSWKLVLVLMHS